MKHVVMIDFGSTFTKVVVVDLVQKVILLTDKVPSTVGTDAMIGLNQCFDIAKTVLTEEEFQDAEKIASSSAAGGLRMSVVGLTDSLSTKAGKAAILGAGAKIIGMYNGKLREEQIAEMEAENTEIILFCGGFDHGNTELVLHNAKMLAKSSIRVPILYSGNTDLNTEIRSIMQAYQKQCFVAENIIPKIGTLNVEPAQSIIRNIFLDKITDMKGFHEVKRYFQYPLTPTPKAVLEAGTLLSQGTKERAGFGPLLIIDIGGATTDVYSFNENIPYRGCKKIGVEEEYAKRTVEGDLGMRESSDRVMEGPWAKKTKEALGMDDDALAASIQKRTQTIQFLPDTEQEKALDDFIGRAAVYRALRRHAGSIRPSYSKTGVKLQEGKNLTEIKMVIGTGGILVYNQNPTMILMEAKKQKADDWIMLPEQMETYLDADYVLFAAGLLQRIDKEAAMQIMLNSIRTC